LIKARQGAEGIRNTCKIKIIVLFLFSEDITPDLISLLTQYLAGKFSLLMVVQHPAEMMNLYMTLCKIKAF